MESLKVETTKESEIKVYGKFLHILNELKTREFSREEIQSIETKLENLNLRSNPENREKYFSKALKQFKKFLRDTFSFTSKGYFTNLGIALGSSFGVLIGVVFLWELQRSLGISYGIGIGLLIGVFLGQYLDARAKADGKVL